MGRYNKFYAAAAAAAGVVASSGLMHGTAELVLNTVIAAVGAAVVALVPNTSTGTPAAPPRAERIP